MDWKSLWKIVAPAVLAVAMVAPSVQAADLGGRDRYRSLKDEPDVGPPRYLWTGFYVGAQAGYGWGTSRHTDALGTTTGDFDMDGFIGGGTLGYNFQSGQVVWGIETDLSFSDVSGQSFVNCPGGCSTSSDWLWTVRGRIGLDMSGWMPYFTGGLAVADGFGRVGGLAQASDTLTGWTIGGGLEVKLDRNWSVKAEYLFVDLGDVRVPTPVPVRADLDELHIVRAGINYKF
jgi:outer membrane immunogenic protein